MALTLLPGRIDRERELATVLDVIGEAGGRHILCLVPQTELNAYGVGDLLQAYEDASLFCHHLPIVDQRIPSHQALNAALDWVQTISDAGHRLLFHCVGGLGRAGLAAACLLQRHGLSAEMAIAEVRRVRSDRAIETRMQEDFVRDARLRRSPHN